MDKRFRTLLGALILTLAISSALVIGIILPINSINIINGVNTNLDHFGKLTVDDIIPNTGIGSYSDWMHTAPSTNESRFYDQAYFEFFNITDRSGYIDYGNPLAYFYIQGELIFDITINKTVLEYNAEDDYVVFTTRRQYTLNESVSTLTGDEKVINVNYMWPYYIEYFGNGTEYGFQSYVATFLLKTESDLLNTSYTYPEIAHAILNRGYAESEGILDLGTYFPHNWISVRPAFQDLDFDQSTSYNMLYNATYDGKDYSILTGDAGAPKFFLDLVRGLDYGEPDDLTVDVTQLLADVYGIDTPTEIESAKSFAAYLNYLLGRPSLDWLYDNKISYICERTTMEWVSGVPDPLLDDRVFPLLVNETLSSSSIDWDQDVYYVERLGLVDPIITGSLTGIANIPFYEYSKSMDVIMENDMAYVLEGGTDIKVVNTTDPLFRAVGQFGDYDGVINDYAVIDGIAYAVEGTKGLEILNVTNPHTIDEIDQWNLGNNDMRGVSAVRYMIGGTPMDALVIANGEIGVKIATLTADTKEVSTIYTFVNSSGTAIAVDARVDINNRDAFVALGTDGIDVMDLGDYAAPDLDLVWHYDSANFSNLKDVRDVKIDGLYLYVLDAIEGMLIFRIQSNKTLTEMGHLEYAPGDEPFNNIYIDGFNAYLTQGEDGFMMVDITDKNNPTEDERFNSTSHLGTAYGIYADGDDIFLADYEQGLVHLDYSIISGDFDFVEKDEIHTFLECWQRDSKVQFDFWDLGPDAAQAEVDPFNYTYDSFSVTPYTERGFRLQWNDFFLKPFAYSSTDTALWFDETVDVYLAQAGVPYLQMDQYDLYWMHAANFINTSFIQVGKWNKMYDLDLTLQDVFITYSLPGQVGRDPFHMQYMMVEPITGVVVDRRDRIQYNTIVANFIEAFEFLNRTKYTGPIQSLPGIHKYPTWHQTFPAVPGGMSTMFWQEDIHLGTGVLYVDMNTDFLDVIEGADTSRTIGAFGSMFLVTIGFVITSVVLHRTKQKTEVIPDN